MNNTACALCCDKNPREIWRNPLVYVIDASEPDTPGFIRVILTRHEAEMTDLSVSERQQLWHILETVERTMRDVLHPDKINLASLGNMVPHLHWHVIARFTDDAFFPGSIWSPKVRTVSDAATQARLNAQTQLCTRLQQVLSAMDLAQF